MSLGWALSLALGVVATAAGCYQPSLHEGAPCGPGDSCPTGQECRAGTCFYTSTPIDSATSSDDAASDAPALASPDAAPDSPVYVPWGTPVNNASLELAQTSEDDPSVTSDRLTVVLTAQQTAGDSDIFIGTRASTTAAFTVVAATALNSAANEGSPEISADGKTIYFTSDRGSADDVYMSTSTLGVWSAPTLVVELSPGGNGDLAISPDGLTAAVMRGGTIYLHTRASTTAAWGTGTAHTELAVTADVAAPSITNGAQTIYFHAGSPRDLYVAHRMGNGTFSTPTPVTELNTTGRDAAPFVNQADDYMIFERDSDIYEVTRP